MAHEWVMKHIHEGFDINYDVLVVESWKYADAMQAEADKREKENSNKQKIKCDEKIEINMYPEWDATINYPPDVWVMYQGEKRLAISIKEEWQPDWSQAPDGYDWFCVGGCSRFGFFCNIEPKIVKVYYWFVGDDSIEVKNHGYIGDWRNSLRKRPQ